MRRVAILAAVFAVATIFATTSHKAHAAALSNAKPTTKIQTASAKPHTIVVQRGDYLTKLAKAYDSTMLRMFYANTQIKDPDLIYPGQKLRVPGATEKLKARALPGEATTTDADGDVDTVQAAPVSHAAAPAVPTPPAPQPVAAPAVTNGSVWDRLADCESSGNWHINTGNGFYGGLQFTLSSWRAVGGSGYPNLASRDEQIARAEKLLAVQGWGAWPACSSMLGLR